MKPIYFFCSMLLLSAMLVSCRLDKPDPLPQGPTYSVKLNVDRERTIHEDEEPMTMVKGAPYDLYAIQVYKKGNTGKYGKHAYGIFDNENDMVLELPAGSTYKIEMSMVPNGASVIAKGENGGYLEPFTTGGFEAGPGRVTNKFTASLNSYLAKLNSGYATLIGNDSETVGCSLPPISRFYGIVDNFTPGENTTLNIHLKWVCFGLTVIPENFTDGSIEIALDGAPKLTVTPDNPTAITKKIFTFDHSLSSEDWADDGYSESIPTKITWVRSDGTREVLRNSTIPTVFKRREEKILRLPLGEQNDKNMTVIKEDEQFISSDEEVIARP